MFVNTALAVISGRTIKYEILNDWQREREREREM